MAVAVTLDRNSAPDHLFNIPELDFSADLFAKRLSDLWFRLGARTVSTRRDERGVEEWLSRQSLLVASEDFSEIFGNLDSIGNVIDHLGQPEGTVHHVGDRKTYVYAAYHRFEFRFASAIGEPVVFIRSGGSEFQLFINPDLWLFLDLEERTRGNGIWWDPRRGVEALRQRVIDHTNVEVVEIRVDYLLQYLQARQMSLIVGHYAHLHLFDPSQAKVEAFVEGDVILGSPRQHAKAILQSWGPRHDSVDATPFLQRRLHLWFEITPPLIDIDDPFAEYPTFDPYTFVLPTRVGPVAPARWTHFRRTEGRAFEGEVCDFMDRIYFRQEVLSKYEGVSGFEVDDNGRVSCHHYWGLVRSTSRLGNDLLATAIGDFAEGVPFEEWSHWKQYAVEPPSTETIRALRHEQSVSGAVNSLVGALHVLNTAFDSMATSLGVVGPGLLWRGSLNSLAGRQLKWVYSVGTDDDEFLKRATLTSTLVIEALNTRSLRTVLNHVGRNLHMNDEDPPRPFGSRNLLQRLTLVAKLIEHFQPGLAGILMLVKQAEGKSQDVIEPDLQAELEIAHNRIQKEFAPLVFLYDLRIHGGLAHTANKDRAARAAARLGLPDENWQRTHYLQLLNLVADSIGRISRHLDSATRRMDGVLSVVE